MAPYRNKGRGKNRGNNRYTAPPGRNVSTPQVGSVNLQAAVNTLVNNSFQQLLGNPSTLFERKRLASQVDDCDDDSLPNFQRQKQSKLSEATSLLLSAASTAPSTSAAAMTAPFPAASTAALSATASNGTPKTSSQQPNYASQVVILEGVDEATKIHPTRLSRAFAAAKPNIELHPDGLRLTASGDVLVKPKNPKDCNALLKKEAFSTPSALGSNVTARVPKSQQVTHQVIIKGVDESVTQEEMDEILTRQELPYKSAKRIVSRQREAPTKLFRLILKDEETKKKLLRDGINLDQMHYRCELALEEKKSYPKVLQCYKCQELGDHLAAACTKEQKCVLCSGPHRKTDCKATKNEFKCANCAGNHASWSQECPRLREAVDAKKTPTFAQVASATVTPQYLMEVIQELKMSMVMLVTEVVSRSICELTYDIQDKKVSKLGLPL